MGTGIDPGMNSRFDPSIYPSVYPSIDTSIDTGGGIQGVNHRLRRDR